MGFRGMNGNALVVDGIIGVQSQHAVRIFQVNYNGKLATTSFLIIDGIPGPATWAALKYALNRNFKAQNLLMPNTDNTSSTSATNNNNTKNSGSDTANSPPAAQHYTGSGVGSGSWIFDTLKFFAGKLKIGNTAELPLLTSSTLGITIILAFGLQIHANASGYIEYDCSEGWTFYTPPVDLPGTTSSTQIGVSPAGNFLISANTGNFSAELGGDFTWTYSEINLKVNYTPNNGGYTAYLKGIIRVDHLTSIAVGALALATSGGSLVPTLSAVGGLATPALNVLSIMVSYISFA
jgi:hypothetical protein